MLGSLSHSTAAAHVPQQLQPLGTQRHHHLIPKRKQHHPAPFQQSSRGRRQLLCGRATADSGPTDSGAGGSGPPPHQPKHTADNGDSNGDKRSGTDIPKRTWPRWYTVWIWATALTYLVWRFKWRRDRRLAAEQFAQEQQQEAELKQEWLDFAKSYGVKAPQDNSST